MIPYELIGRLTVATVAAIAVEVAVIALAVAFLFVWVRFWKRVCDLCWKGYDVHTGPNPPLWRRKIAVVAYGLRNFKHPRDVHEAVREVHDVDGGDA